MWSFLGEALKVLNESAIYLLIGFALAGMTNVLLSRYQNVARAMGRGGSKSVIWASVLGLPLPLCSCSVLPAGMALRKQGASKGATSSFLISVPETDVISIALTWGLLGPILAIVRPVAALLTAISTGLIVDVVDTRFGKKGRPKEEQTGEKNNLISTQAPGEHKGFAWIRQSLRFGFVSMFDDLVGQLLLGILIAGIVTALLPNLAFLHFVRGSVWGYLIMLAVGIPTYVCATAATPIAAGLIAGGISPGAALVFLLAGPATNTASLVVLGRNFGRWAMAAYLIPIAVISVLVGIIFDTVLGGLAIPIVSAVTGAEGASLIKILGTIAFALLVIRSFARTKFLDRSIRDLGRRLGKTWNPGTVKGALLVLALLVYLSSGLFTVGPGERGVVKLFGKITASYLMPGLHYHLPVPFGDADVASVREIKSVEFAVRRASQGFDAAFVEDFGAPGEGDTWLLAGDENLLDAQCVVHYQIEDSEEALLHYLYGVRDKEGLVRSGVEWALATAVASRGIDSLLTVDRESVEMNVRDELLQPFLQNCESGMRVVDVNLLEVHAPQPVHWSFRDVASAAEDKMQKINIARGYRERVVREAHGEAAGVVSYAVGKAKESVELARGEGDAFVLQTEAYREGPLVTRLRLYLESLDYVLPNLNKYVDMTSKERPGLEFWLGRSAKGSPPFVPPANQPWTTVPEEEQ
jgi:HflK protein